MQPLVHVNVHWLREESKLTEFSKSLTNYVFLFIKIFFLCIGTVCMVEVQTASRRYRSYLIDPLSRLCTALSKQSLCLSGYGRPRLPGDGTFLLQVGLISNYQKNRTFRPSGVLKQTHAHERIRWLKLYVNNTKVVRHINMDNLIHMWGNAIFIRIHVVNKAEFFLHIVTEEEGNFRDGLQF